MTTRMFIMYAAALSMSAPSVFAEPVGTAFTYQGQLKLAGRPVGGLTDMRFTLWNDDVGGTRIGGILTFDGGAGRPPRVDVINGLFAVDLDFGGGAFDGQARWLQIEVKHPPGVGAYTLITPRQPVTPAPYAIRALNTPSSHALDAADGLPTNAVYVNNDGNVGIKTIDADSTLTVQSFTTDTFRLLGPGDGGSTAKLHLGNLNDVYLTEDVEDHLTIFSLQRTAIMGGEVGIGTTDPSHRLTVRAANNKTVRLLGPQTPGLDFGARINFGEGDDAYIEEDLDDKLLLYARVRTSIMGGNVGIGMFDPAAKLDVNAPSGGIGVYARSNGGGTGSSALRAHNAHASGIGIFSTTNSSDANVVIANPGTGDLIRGFSGPGGGNLRFRVENSGKTTVPVLTITGGSDLAEPFFVGSDGATERRSDEGIKPGMVAVIDPHNPGMLKLSHQAYDRKVAGIISGANGLAPGMIMSDQGNPLADGNHPVALTGRVWCWCDAGNAAIEPGDLLTTSNRIGHAMKVTDYANGQGAILGKAMSPLPQGTGLVLVLVSLQ